MRVLMIRHAKTPGNEERRYIGRTDEPLSEIGIAEAEALEKNPSLEFVFVSPYRRAKETASILFPNAKQIVIDGLREMDFGVFEGRNADEMENDRQYRAWVDSMCEDPCPGGEKKADFAARCVDAFLEALKLAQGDAVFVVHGGTVMSVFEALAEPKRSYYSYSVKNLSGWQADCAVENGIPVLRNMAPYLIKEKE